MFEFLKKFSEVILLTMLLIVAMAFGYKCLMVILMIVLTIMNGYALYKEYDNLNEHEKSFLLLMIVVQTIPIVLTIGWWVIPFALANGCMINKIRGRNSEAE